ncbi:MAG: multidrug DMT transporter [Thiobacillus sp. SCN 65-179]|nr:MAG: multidrug DMT transporter [Thiobacillus sp. SCN 65-179]
MSVPAAYLGVILIWSTTPLAIQWSAQGAGFSFAVMARMLIGLAVCLVLLAATRTAFPFTPAARRLYAVSGLSLFASMLLTYWGALHIPSGLISVIFGLSPLVTGVFAALWLAERTLTPLRIAGLALALAGLWLIFGQPWPGDRHAALGTLATVSGMALQALGLVWIKRLNVRVSSLAITTGSPRGVSVPCFVLAWVIADAAQLPADATLRAGAAIVYLGILGSVVGFTLYYYMIKHLDAGRIALIMLVTPVSALLLGQTLNHERIPAIGWAGIALIGAGLLLYEWQALRQLRRPLIS